VKTLALAFLLLLASLLAAPARAETPADDEAAASALVDQAAHAYDQNQLDQALQLLAQAYELSPRPSILYNQAQVLRAKDDCPAALDAYRRFIDTTAPDDPNRERAVHWRDEMQTCADRRNPPPPPAPPPPPVRLSLEEAPRSVAPPPAMVISTPAKPETHPVHHRRALRITGWASIGVSIVAAGAAVAYAWEAHHIQDEFSMPADWKTVRQPLYEEGTRDANRAWWCAGAAALTGAGGTALLVISRPPTAGVSAPATSAPPTTLIAWSGTF
jgi:tetratricopeptide (TPR) repeat protein